VPVVARSTRAITRIGKHAVADGKVVAILLQIHGTVVCSDRWHVDFRKAATNCTGPGRP